MEARAYQAHLSQVGAHCGASRGAPKLTIAASHTILRSFDMLLRNAVLGLCFALVACVSFGENLRRGVEHHESERWSAALAVWLEIEADAPTQTRAERGQYHAYRGLTHLRLGARADARHHFALAHQFWAALPADLRRRVDEAERDLAGPSR